MPPSLKVHANVRGSEFGADPLTKKSIACPTAAGFGVAVGPDVMLGAATTGLTVSVAELLVVLPAPLETTTLKLAPLSAKVVGGVVYDAPVAPAMVDPFFDH